MAKPRTLANSVADGGPLANGDPTIADVTGLQAALDAKQGTLVSGTNIKTINGTPLLGSGNIVTPSGPSGADTRTDSATLTSTSNALQVLNMSAYGKYIRLPDATTLTTGPGKFVLDNAYGKFPVGVLDGAGTVLGQIIPGTVTSFGLKSSATAAGDWMADGNLDPWWIDTNTGLDFASTVEPSLYYIDANRSLLYYRKPTTLYPAIRLVTYNGAGVAPTISAELILRAASTTLNSSLYRLMGANRLFCVTADYYGMVVDLSNASTLSVGTAVAITFTNCALNDLAAFDSQYLVGYGIDTTSFVLRAKCFDVGTSGTTITIGTEASSAAYGAASGNVIDFRLRGTNFAGIYGYIYNPNNWYDYFFYTLNRTSGTTLSWSAKLGNPTGSRTDTADQPLWSYFNIATDKILLPYWANSYAGRYVVVTWASGSTPTFGAVATSNIASNSTTIAYTSSPDYTKFIAWNTSNVNSKQMEAVTVSGTTVTVGASTAYTSDAQVKSGSPTFVGVDNNGRGVVSWTSSVASTASQRDKLRTFSLSGTTFTLGTEVSSSFYGGMAGAPGYASVGSLQNQSPGLFYSAASRYNTTIGKYYGITELFTINSDLTRNVIASVEYADQYFEVYGINGVTDRLAWAKSYAPPTEVGSESFVLFLNGKIKRGKTMWGMSRLQVTNGATDYYNIRYLPAAFIYPDDRDGRNGSFVTYQIAGA